EKVDRTLDRDRRAPTDDERTRSDRGLPSGGVLAGMAGAHDEEPNRAPLRDALGELLRRDLAPVVCLDRSRCATVPAPEDAGGLGAMAEWVLAAQREVELFAIAEQLDHDAKPSGSKRGHVISEVLDLFHSHIEIGFGCRLVAKENKERLAVPGPR